MKNPATAGGAVLRDGGRPLPNRIRAALRADSAACLRREALLFSRSDRTAPGDRWLVRDAILNAGVRCGLPIVDEDGLRTPAQRKPRTSAAQ